MTARHEAGMLHVIPCNPKTKQKRKKSRYAATTSSCNTDAQSKANTTCGNIQKGLLRSNVENLLGSFGTFATWQREDNSPVTQKNKKKWKT